MRHSAGGPAEAVGEDRAAPGTSAGMNCVGIVIRLPESLSRELERWRASFGDPLAAVVPPHITLVTGTDTDDWEGALEHVRTVARRGRPFSLRLRGTGTFRPVTPVVYLNVAEGWDECVRLHGMLQSGPLASDLEFEYHPHLTVAHDVTDAGMDYAMSVLSDYDAAFRVESIGLFEHDVTGLWTLREELPLGGNGTEDN
ncbi:MAG: 2'-5' RNA ligase family protein [Arthrobacter sp.]|uniref:2'-5' RNA ligase family protein n=1 Tax=Arthrobacter sp. TaxID=1667 RepID=UPI0034925F59